MASVPSGLALTKIFTTPPLLGFLPVAAEFKVFDIMVRLGKEVTGEDVLAEYKKTYAGGSDAPSDPALQLIQDSLHAMAGLGIIDSPADNRYTANKLTEHLVAQPSALHGGIHFATEILLSAAFLHRKLKAENYAYPFAENKTPMQFAQASMGNTEYAKMHTYAIMSEEGRMDSFNNFMEGKFFDLESNVVRLQKLGYDMASVLEQGPEDATKMVDIGGGRGEMLLQFKEAHPHLTAKDLVVEEFELEGDTAGLTMVQWNFKEDKTQPIKGALIYHLAHVLHNLPDLDAIQLLQKLAAVMAPHSRILVHEMKRSVNMAFLHTAMMILFGGRERSPEEFKQMAEVAGLKVTFIAFPEHGDGVVEMMKP